MIHLKKKNPPDFVPRVIFLVLIFIPVPDANPSSDVSLDSEATTDSKLAASSSAVSLEVDNDAPYWTSQPTTFSKQADLNIEDRIPVSEKPRRVKLLVRLRIGSAAKGGGVSSGSFA